MLNKIDDNREWLRYAAILTVKGTLKDEKIFDAGLIVMDALANVHLHLKNLASTHWEQGDIRVSLDNAGNLTVSESNVTCEKWGAVDWVVKKSATMDEVVADAKLNPTILTKALEKKIDDIVKLSTIKCGKPLYIHTSLPYVDSHIEEKVNSFRVTDLDSLKAILLAHNESSKLDALNEWVFESNTDHIYYDLTESEYVEIEKYLKRTDLNGLMQYMSERDMYFTFMHPHSELDDSLLYHPFELV